MAINIVAMTDAQFADLLSRGEGHFLDYKAKEVSPAKLTKSLSAFANADGGELFIGILNSGSPTKRWSGFADAEAANGHIQAFEQFFPLGSYLKYQFLRSERYAGLLLHCEILKTPDIRSSSDGVFYLRAARKICLKLQMSKFQDCDLTRASRRMRITSSRSASMKLQTRNQYWNSCLRIFRRRSLYLGSGSNSSSSTMTVRR